MRVRAIVLAQLQRASSKRKPFLLALSAFVAVSCVSLYVYKVTRPSLSGLDLEWSIHAAEKAIRDLLGPDGKFIYRFDAESAQAVSPGYSLIRHAGTIYSLEMYEERFPNAKTKDAIALAIQYLLKLGVHPLPEQGETINAVFTSSGGSRDILAGLGETGLSLIALLYAERIQPESVDHETLVKLGRFLIFMQKPSGEFYNEYSPVLGGREEGENILFYPGEAILALALLYKWDHQAKWLTAAKRGLSFLAASRQGQEETALDNWALLATAEIVNESADAEKSVFLRHAIQIDKSDLTGQVSKSGPYQGCYTPEGRSSKSATRLEGLLSSLTFLPPSEEELRRTIRHSVHAGIRCLINSQYRTGPYVGAIRNAISQSARLDPATGAASEVRIDYIQHGLSALLRYWDLRQELERSK